MRTFFKIVCYSAYRARREDLANSEFWALEKPGMILKYFFLNTFHLQPFFSSNGKRFLKKNLKAFRNILDSGLVAYFSSTLYKHFTIETRPIENCLPYESFLLRFSFLDFFYNKNTPWSIISEVFWLRYFKMDFKEL